MHDGRKTERRFGGVVLALAAALILAGCSSTDLLSATGLSRFVGNSGTPVSTNPNAAQQDIECPTVDYRVGAASLSLTAPGEQTASNVRYLLSFAQTARECLVSGANMTMKVGVEGRIILGPLGASGNVDVPLRYSVVREGPEPKTIITKFQQITVTIEPGQNSVPFINIADDLTFPIPPGAEIDAYVVYVGFDPAGAPKTPPRKSPAKKAPLRKGA